MACSAAATTKGARCRSRIDVLRRTPCKIVTIMTRKFADYCEAKTERAVSAQLPGFETRFMRLPSRLSAEAPGANAGPLVAIGNDWSRRLFDGWFYRCDSGDPARPS